MIGVIADDLSGAAEIAAIGHRFGLNAQVVVGTYGPAGWTLDAARCASANGARTRELICVDTDSRLCAEPEARRRAALAANVLKRASARWIYKKIDSVLRGHVIAEIDSIMNEWRLARAIVVAANPSRGRFIRRGRYWIGDRPIHQTEFARDPEYPRSCSAVRQLVGVQDRDAVYVLGPHAPLPRKGIVLGEAGSARALHAWAGRSRQPMLLAGAAEFFTAILNTRGFRETPAGAASDPGSGRELFVCGTMSAAAAAFVKRSRAARVPVFSLPSELASGGDFNRAAIDSVARRVTSALKRHARVILTIGLPPVRDPAVGRSLTTHLVRLAANVIRLGSIERIYAEGGATAAALVTQMGWTRLEVLAEVAPGVAMLGTGEGNGIRLAIKPGSYPWPGGVGG